MSITSSLIYSKGVRPGVIRYWQFEIEGDQWRGHFGVVGGKDTVSKWSTAKPTNLGKSNERDGPAQAHFEAVAEEAKKLKREYRVLMEDLEGPNAPPPAVMLAQKWADLKTPLKFNPGRPVNVQPKLDGIRLVDEERDSYSREFQPFFTTAHIREALRPIRERYPHIILDGELYNHSLKNNFNKIGSLVRKKSLTEVERVEVVAALEYHIYDVPSLDAVFSERTKFLVDLFGEFEDHLQFCPIVRVPTFEVHTLTELEARRDQFLEDGYEGMMVRQDEEYEFGVRSWSLMKHKGDKTTEEFPISKLIEGNGNWSGCAKAVEIVLDEADTRGANGERQKAGIKGDQDFCRALLTTTPGPTMVTVEYFGRTPGGMLRFPVAVDWHYGERTD